MIAVSLSGCAVNTQLPPFRNTSTAEKAVYVIMTNSAANEAGIPYEEFVRIIAVESSFNPTIRGAHGEYGLGQIKCETARSVGFTGDCANLFDATTNLRYSARYYAIARKKCGTFAGAVYLYNAGVGASCSGRNDYVERVTNRG